MRKKFFHLPTIPPLVNPNRHFKFDQKFPSTETVARNYHMKWSFKKLDLKTSNSSSTPCEPLRALISTSTPHHLQPASHSSPTHA